MKIKSIITATILAFSTYINASPMLSLGNGINSCPLEETNNTLDLALRNAGYFVVSDGKKGSELFFTRYGKMHIGGENYIATSTGEYLLGIAKNSDPHHLRKLKISTKNLAPKATSQVFIEVNLPENAVVGEEFQSSSRIYDSISKTHVLTLKMAKTSALHWKVSVYKGNMVLTEGQLEFNKKGFLKKQEGLKQVQFPMEYGLQELSIDFKNSTQYATSFYVQLFNNNGYPVGMLSDLTINMNGDLALGYTNGQVKILKNRIAVALFTNPHYLEKVQEHLYRPTDISGQPKLHWVNGEFSVLSGYLEQDICLKS